MGMTMALIVVADDDGDLRALMALVLKRDGHTVVETADGVEALDAVRDRRPDAVVSDIDMPHMSGTELCVAIRADPAFRDLPVLLVSGSIMPGDDRPRQVQATALLRKPFVRHELTACLNTALGGGHRYGQPPTECH
jgi:CheY-like chemotaxis protein